MVNATRNVDAACAEEIQRRIESIDRGEVKPFPGTMAADSLKNGPIRWDRAAFVKPVQKQAEESGFVFD